MFQAGWRRPRRARLMSLVLAMGLGLSTPTSSRAILTELVVGGTVLLQVAGIVGEALPQISALATSFAAVVQSGDQIGKTAGRIIDILIPNRKKKGGGEPPADQPPPEDPPSDGPSTERPAARKPGRRLNLPSLKPRPTGSRKGPDESARPVPADVGDEEKQPDSLDGLFLAFHRKASLEKALVDAEGDRREAMEAGLPILAGRYEEAVEGLVEDLEAAARSGDSDAIEDVATRAGEAPMGLRRGLEPVFERLLGRGRRFGDLYDGAAGGDDTARALAPLVPVAESLSGEEP